MRQTWFLVSSQHFQNSELIDWTAKHYRSFVIFLSHLIFSGYLRVPPFLPLKGRILSFYWCFCGWFAPLRPQNVVYLLRLHTNWKNTAGGRRFRSLTPSFSRKHEIKSIQNEMKENCQPNKKLKATFFPGSTRFYSFLVFFFSSFSSRGLATLWDALSVRPSFGPSIHESITLKLTC